MVIIDGVINTLLGGQTLDPAGMHCPAGDDAFVSSSELFFGLPIRNLTLAVICSDVRKNFYIDAHLQSRP